MVAVRAWRAGALGHGWRDLGGMTEATKRVCISKAEEGTDVLIMLEQQGSLCLSEI
jgi:hypothetical protein